MTVHVKFSSADIAGKLRDGEYELPDGATVATLIDAALLESGYELPENKRSNFVFVFNNSPAQYETELCDEGKLRVLYRITGG